MKKPPKTMYVVMQSKPDYSLVEPLAVCRTKHGSERVMAGWRAEIDQHLANDWVADEYGVWVSRNRNCQIFTEICNYHET